MHFHEIYILKEKRKSFQKYIYLDELIMYILYALDVTANIIECKYYYWLFKLRFESINLLNQ